MINGAFVEFNLEDLLDILIKKSRCIHLVSKSNVKLFVLSLDQFIVTV